VGVFLVDSHNKDLVSSEKEIKDVIIEKNMVKFQYTWSIN
jgi:hypothetical protein